jgi:acetylornithine deacetylase/succinyl-diaminopimelate desuccinylase-like protein
MVEPMKSPRMPRTRSRKRGPTLFDDDPHSSEPPFPVRFVAGIDEADILPALRRHLDREGFADVTVSPAGDAMFRATMLDPDHPWAQWAVASIARTTGSAPAVIPSFGGALPNDVFAEILGLPTVWVPHSYPGCSQHAPDEHVPMAVVREGLAIMAGLYWDLGEPGTP